MAKQTKNIITRKSIEDDLLFYTSADMRSTLVWGGAISLLGVPSIILLANFLKPTDRHPLSLICYGFILLLFISLLLSLFIPIPRALKEKKLIRSGEVEIVVLPLLYKQEKVYRHHTYKLLYFEGFKGEMVGNTEYDLASAKQEYYIVHYRNSKEIKMIFSTERYEYREQE